MSAPGVSTDNRGPALDTPGVPVLLVVDADPQALQTTAADLDRRFAPDYRWAPPTRPLPDW